MTTTSDLGSKRMDVANVRWNMESINMYEEKINKRN